MKKSLMMKNFCLLVILILIFGTTNALADSCNAVYQSGLTGLTSLSANMTNGRNNMNHNFYNNQTINFGNVDYIKGQMWYVIQDTSSGTYYSNINLNLSCSSYSDQLDSGASYTITYADGSQANVSGTIYANLCTQYTGNNGYYGYSQVYQPNISMIGLRIGTSSNMFDCEVDTNGNYKCPVSPTRDYTRFNFSFYLNNSSGSNVSYGLTNTIINQCSSDTQMIINNQNQNTQTIVNNITSPTIDSNTNTDNLITLPNSNGKNTILDLLMIPINFIANIVNSFSNSCVSVNLGNLLGTDLILPCINLQNILGSTLYTIIDSIFAFGILFAFIRAVKRFIQKALLLANDVSSEVSIF